MTEKMENPHGSMLSRKYHNRAMQTFSYNWAALTAWSDKSAAAAVFLLFLFFVVFTVISIIYHDLSTNSSRLVLAACTCSLSGRLLWIQWQGQTQSSWNLTWFLQRWERLTIDKSGKRRRLNFRPQTSQIHTVTFIWLIMHGAHLVHMQTFWQPSDVWVMSQTGGDTSFLTLQSESDGGWVVGCQVC